MELNQDDHTVITVYTQAYLCPSNGEQHSYNVHNGFVIKLKKIAGSNPWFKHEPILMKISLSPYQLHVTRASMVMPDGLRSSSK